MFNPDDEYHLIGTPRSENPQEVNEVIAIVCLAGVVLIGVIGVAISYF